MVLGIGGPFGRWGGLACWGSLRSPRRAYPLSLGPSVHALGVSLLDGGGAAVVAARGQALHHACDVARRAVLAQLGLGLDPGDVKLQADDGPQLALDERARRVVYRPRHLLA